WIYPLPENIGITLDRDRGNVVEKVVSQSPADRAGLRAGDMVQKLNQFSVASFADAQYALNKAPAKGEIEAVWLREGQTQTAKLTLADGWRRTNLTWRPSMLDLLPSLPLYGKELTGAERKTLGLTEKQLAFRQGKPVHPQALQMGVREGDVIVGLD